MRIVRRDPRGFGVFTLRMKIRMTSGKMNSSGILTASINSGHSLCIYEIFVGSASGTRIAEP